MRVATLTEVDLAWDHPPRTSDRSRVLEHLTERVRAGLGRAGFLLGGVDMRGVGLLGDSSLSVRVTAQAGLAIVAGNQVGCA